MKTNKAIGGAKLGSIVMISALLAACGGGGDDSSDTAPASNHTSTPVSSAPSNDVGTTLPSTGGYVSDTPATGNTPSNPFQPVEQPVVTPVVPVVVPPVVPPVVTAPAPNHAPQIAGAATPTAIVGQLYDFRPNAVDADGDTVKFSISSKPSWASFDANTGRLWGVPAVSHIGSYEEIVVTASDGRMSTQLPEFSVVVSAAAATVRNATLSWRPPTQNTDGSTLTNLSGYKIHYGTRSGTYTEVVDVDNAGLTRFVLEDLDPGVYYFVITAVAGDGVESDYSSEVSAKII